MPAHYSPFIDWIMLKGISWGLYLSVLSTAVLAYYLIIGLMYYRPEISRWISRRTRPGRQPEQAATGNNPPPPHPAQETVLSPELQDLGQVLYDIRYDVLPKAGNHVTKDKLLVVLGQYFKANNAVLTGEYQPAVLNLVLREAKEQCGIQLTEQELHQLWDSLID